MHAEDVILVTDATGNTGSAVLQQLANRGAVVRAMVRSTKDAARMPNASATVVVGNFDDRRSLEAALEGVTERICGDAIESERGGRRVRFAELAAAAGVRRLVKLSSCGGGDVPGALSSVPRDRQTARP